MPLFQSKVRLYLTVDDRVVGEGDPHAHQLLVPAGGTLSFQQARKYGLVKAVDGPPTTAAITHKRTKGTRDGP